MEDWEDVPTSDLLKKEQPKSSWDDEDVDDDAIKESWEDDDESEQAATEEPPPERISKKPVAKTSEKKGKAVEVDKAGPSVEKLDPVAEKLRQQRLVEEADYKSTAELFGKKGDEKTIDNFIPKSENDFQEYAELISHKLRPYEKSYHYIGLLKEVMRLSMKNLKGVEMKDVASSITAVANSKIKEEKETNAGKKKGSKKKQLHIGKDEDDVVATAAYDDFDDYDFM